MMIVKLGCWQIWLLILTVIHGFRGWYQNVGAGSFYKVTIKQVEGQAIKVMTSAHGGGMWSDGHYYTSQALADVNKNRTYPDDHLN